MKFSKKRIDAVEPDPGKPIYLWDENLAGFGVKILPSGKKRYIVKYRTYGGERSATQRWMTLCATLSKKVTSGQTWQTP